MTGAWGPPVTVPAVDPVPWPALAVDARGDAAVAWREETPRTQTVRVAYLDTGDRTAARRTLVAPSAKAATGLTAALDHHGALTVVWVERGSSSGRLKGHITLRAVRRTSSGHWSAPQVVSRLSPFFYAQPRLAVAADGTVALTYNSGTRVAPGVAIAWARPGRPFGTPHAVSTGRLGYLQEPNLAFDPRGRLRLSGVAGCDDETCSRGVLLTAPGALRRFGRPRTIAPAPVNHLQLTLSARGPAVGLATWLRAGCSTTEDLSGTPMAATVTDGSVSAPLALDPSAGAAPLAARAPGGATDVAWTGYPPSAPGGTLLGARVLPGPPPATSPAGALVPGNGWAPTSGDPTGDQALMTPLPRQAAGVRSLAARDATGTVAPAPLPAVNWPVTAAADDGRALAGAAPGRRSIRFSVWRPTG